MRGQWSTWRQETGEVYLKENYVGLVEIEKVDEQKKLWFVLSFRGDNLANISQIKMKSIRIVSRVINKLNSLYACEFT